MTAAFLKGKNSISCDTLSFDSTDKKLKFLSDAGKICDQIRLSAVQISVSSSTRLEVKLGETTRPIGKINQSVHDFYDCLFIHLFSCL